MTDLILPIVEDDFTQGDVLRAMQAAGSGAAAVRAGTGFAILTARAVIDADVDTERAGELAQTMGLGVADPGDIVSIDPRGVTLKGARMHLLKFADTPSGYKQCQINDNHTYKLSDPRTKCWRDSGDLVNVYI